MRKENEYISYLQRVYPELKIRSAYINEIGQNNDVLIVNKNIVFRFRNMKRYSATANRNAVARENKTLHYASNSQPELSRVSR